MTTVPTWLVEPVGMDDAARALGVCLTICRGGDFETLVLQAGRPATGPGLPPAFVPGQEEMAAFAAQCSANGIDLIGPPLTAGAGSRIDPTGVDLD